MKCLSIQLHKLFITTPEKYVHYFNKSSNYNIVQNRKWVHCKLYSKTLCDVYPVIVVPEKLHNRCTMIYKRILKVLKLKFDIFS